MLQLAVDDGVQFVVARRVGIVGNAQRGVGTVVLLQREIDAHAVGSAFLLAHGIGVGDGQDALQEVEFEVALGREIHVGSVVDADVGERRGHLLREAMDAAAAHDLRNVCLVGLLALVRGGQRGQILAEQRAQSGLVVVADDDRLEIGSVRESLLIDLENAVVVGLVERGLHHGLHSGMVAVEDGADGVVVIDARRGIAVGQERACAIHQAQEGNRVATRLREVEMHELEHRLDVLDRAARRDALASRAHRRTHAHGLSREHLAQRGSVEIAHTGLGDTAADEREVRNVFVAIERRAALALERHLDAVGGVGGLFRIDFHPIRQRQLRETMFERLFAHNGARLGQVFHQIFSQLHVLVGRVVLLLGGEHDLPEQGLVGQRNALFVGAVEHEHLIFVGDELLGSAVHLVERHLAVEFLRVFEVKLRGNERFARQEIRHALVHEMAVSTVVALFVAALGVGHADALRTLQLARRETVLARLLHRGNGRNQTAENVLLLAAHREREGLFRATHEERTGPSRSVHKRRIGRLPEVRQSVVEHRADEAVEIFVAQVFRRVFLAVGRGVALHIEVRHHDGLLGVFLDGDNHFLVVGNGVIDALGGIFRLRNLRKELFDFLLDLVHVDVADNDNSLKVRAIPLLIIVAQILVGEVIDDFHRADGQAILVFRTFVDARHHVFRHSLHRHSCASRAPFLVDNTAFLVDFLVFEQNVVAPVVQHEQTRVEDSLALQRHGTHMIDRLIDTRIGVQIGTELHADALAPGHDAKPLSLSGEVFRAVEGHVFQKMRQSALTRLFEDASHALCDVEIGQSSLFGIVAQVVGHSVFQCALAHGRVLGQSLLPTLPENGRSQEENG